MVDDTLDNLEDEGELDAEADEEVEKVLFEITDGKLGQAGKVGTDLPVKNDLFVDIVRMLIAFIKYRRQNSRKRNIWQMLKLCRNSWTVSMITPSNQSKLQFFASCRSLAVIGPCSFLSL
jgi:hypothetical protein